MLTGPNRRDERTPAERLADTGAFVVDDTGAFVVDDEGNVEYTARLLHAVQTDPALLDDVADVFGAEGAQAISAVVMENARGADRQRSALERLLGIGAFTVDTEGNMIWVDRERLFRAAQENPVVLDDYAEVFGREAAMELAEYVRERNEWPVWKRVLAIAGFIVPIAVIIALLASGYVPIVLIGRVIWGLFRVFS